MEKIMGIVIVEEMESRNGNSNGGGNENYGNNNGNGNLNGMNGDSKAGNELWDLCVKGTDIAGYTRRFHKLALMCPRMVPEEEDKIERFIWGLLDNIQGNVTSSPPTRFQDAIKMANSLMDQKLCAYAARNANNERKFKNQPRDNRVPQKLPFKIQNMARDYTAGTNKKKAYAGNLPYYNKCKLHHAGPCTVKCLNCKKVGHMARYFKNEAPTTNQRALVVN
ncbi:hypothetical protein Tco_0716906 [Tanacetum coccineum]